MVPESVASLTRCSKISFDLDLKCAGIDIRAEKYLSSGCWWPLVSIVHGGLLGLRRITFADIFFVDR